MEEGGFWCLIQFTYVKVKERLLKLAIRRIFFVESFVFTDNPGKWENGS